MQAECDFCHKRFEFKPHVRKDGQFTVGYFACPHCKHEYISYVENDEVKHMQSRRRRLLKMIQEESRKRPTNRKRVDYLQEQFQELDGKYIKVPGKIAERMDKLKKQYLKQRGAE